MGCWFSVGPAMLAGERGKVLALKMPRDRILTKTDGPLHNSKIVLCFPGTFAMQSMRLPNYGALPLTLCRSSYFQISNDWTLLECQSVDR